MVFLPRIRLRVHCFINVILLHVVGSSTSIGCHKNNLTSGNHTITIGNAADLPKIERRFVLHIPKNQTGSLPLVMGFHGQSGSPETWGPEPYFTKLAQDHGWVIAYPAGLREGTTDGGSDVTWNVGTAGDNSTCIPNTSGVQCMNSCAQTAQCGSCNWATCYDDGLFIERLVQQLEDKVDAPLSTTNYRACQPSS